MDQSNTNMVARVGIQNFDIVAGSTGFADTLIGLPNWKSG
jgi:hypothetical protein